MNLLLHICCAPCSVACIKQLRGEGIEPTGFWYNPNIHPFTEYRSRRNCLRMKLSSRYRGKTVVHTLEHLISDKACPEAFRTVEFEQVRLRLRMPVRKISGPVSSVI